MNIPPFLMADQFTAEQSRQTSKVARARVHVERAIGYIKTFKILDEVPVEMLPHVSNILKVVCQLVNYQSIHLKSVDLKDILVATQSDS